MTEAVRKQLEAAGVPVKRTKPPAPSPVPPAAKEAPVASVLPPPDYANPDTQSAMWLFDSGRLSVSLARPHGRQRLAIAGVPDEALVAVVLGAIEKHFKLKTP